MRLAFVVMMTLLERQTIVQQRPENNRRPDERHAEQNITYISIHGSASGDDSREQRFFQSSSFVATSPSIERLAIFAPPRKSAARKKIPGSRAAGVWAINVLILWVGKIQSSQVVWGCTEYPSQKISCNTAIRQFRQ
jgi:hypothetical protein